MSLYARLFAGVYDRCTRNVESSGLSQFRVATAGVAVGRVLEIGAGTGANLPYYPAAIEELTLTDPNPHMLKRLERRLDRPATVLCASADALPFDDGAFDTVVCSLVLCGVPDQPTALRELRRVLRSGGDLCFLEHVRSEDPEVARRQDRVNGLHRLFARCECNRATLEAIEAAGFRVTSLERASMPQAPSYVRPLIVGTATA